MRIMFTAFAGFLILSGCAEMRYAGDSVQSTTTREAQLSQNKLSYILDPDRRVVKLPPQPIKPSYCYKNFGDIVCYKDPLPNARSRLVGYQEPLVRAPDTADANGFEPVEYRDGDRSKVFNPYANESGTTDAYVPKEQSFWRNFDRRGGNTSSSSAHDSDVRPSAKTSSYLGSSAPVDNDFIGRKDMAPVVVQEPIAVREFDMVETAPYCPEACKKAVKEPTAKKKSAAKSSAKKSAKAKPKKAKAKAKTKAKTVKKAKVVTEKAPVEASVSEPVSAPVAPSTSSAVPQAPKAPEPKTTTVKKLEEIKYDKNAADPKETMKQVR